MNFSRDELIRAAESLSYHQVTAPSRVAAIDRLSDSEISKVASSLRQDSLQDGAFETADQTGRQLARMIKEGGTISSIMTAAKSFGSKARGAAREGLSFKNIRQQVGREASGELISKGKKLPGGGVLLPGMRERAGIKYRAAKRAISKDPKGFGTALAKDVGKAAPWVGVPAAGAYMATRPKAND